MPVSNLVLRLQVMINAVILCPLFLHQKFMDSQFPHKSAKHHDKSRKRQKFTASVICVQATSASVTRLKDSTWQTAVVNK